MHCLFFSEGISKSIY